MAKIYTRTGDKGTTSLFTGKRVSKSDPLIEAIGTVDECNSAIGTAIAALPTEPGFEKIKDRLESVQHALFDIGAYLATPRDEADEKKIEITHFGDECVLSLEKWMDEMDAALPPLKNFILPGGHLAGALLHLARSVCRRAERDVTEVIESDSPSIYLNRLSDYLFVSARWVNQMAEVPETSWKH